jgi:hypothetical protein
LPQATGLTLLEQDLESALAAIPSGYGEGVYEGLRCGVSARTSGVYLSCRSPEHSFSAAVEVTLSVDKRYRIPATDSP